MVKSILSIQEVGNEGVTRDPSEHEKTSSALKEVENSDNNSKQHRSKYSNIFRYYSWHKNTSMDKIDIIIILISIFFHFHRGNAAMDSNISVQDIVLGMELNENQKEELLRKLEKSEKKSGLKKAKKSKKESSKDQNLLKKLNVNSIEACVNKVSFYTGKYLFGKLKLFLAWTT